MYALKELAEHLARREYALLGRFEDEGLPAVSVLGICVDRPHGQDAILVTRYLENSMSYRYLFSNPPGEPSAAQLLDILVILLVRLHLAGVYWGDCSLSNTLFPPDAGTYSAYFVDAETAEHHVALSPGQRRQDVDQARERVGGELLDLQSAESLPADFDPIGVADALPVRYTELWHEVTREEVFQRADQRYRIAERLRRLNDLGFDVGEVELVDLPGGGVKLRVDTRISPPETNRRELFRLTGLEVQEGQARRLLNDVRSFRAHLERQTGSSVSDTVAAQHWLTEVYQAVIDAIPPELSGRLAAAEVFHEVLEHRWVPLRGRRSRHRHDQGCRVLLRDRSPARSRGGHVPVGHRWRSVTRERVPRAYGLGATPTEG
ncbi:DUF4032 domain-containing protein [Modestobacter lacusdianchii]